MSGLTLYELESSLVTAVEHLADCDGDVAKREYAFEVNDSEENLVALEDAREAQAEAQQILYDYLEAATSKRDRVAAYLAHADAQAKLAADEIKRLQGRKKAIENRRDSLKQHLCELMGRMGLDKLPGETTTLCREKSPRSVEVTDVDALPEWAKVEVPAVWNPDKKEIAKALREGKEIPGAKYGEQKWHLRVR